VQQGSVRADAADLLDDELLDLSGGDGLGRAGVPAPFLGGGAVAVLNCCVTDTKETRCLSKTCIIRGEVETGGHGLLLLGLHLAFAVD
jgi:hypothetical protein